MNIQESAVLELEELDVIQKGWDQERHFFKNKVHPDDFPPLPELPAARYTDEAFYQLEQEHLWSKTWVLAGFANEIAKPGDFKAMEINDRPIVLVRGKDREIRAFYNVCQHRGSTICKTANGNAKQLTCPYHGWTYDLEGNLQFVPAQHEFPALDPAQKPLRSIRCEMNGNLIYVSFDDNAQPHQRFLGNIGLLMSDIPFDQVMHYETVAWTVESNWKSVQDAFSEAYHARFVHAQTAHQSLDTTAPVKYLFKHGHYVQINRSRQGEAGIFGQNQEAADESRTIGQMKPLTRYGQRAYNLFPNLTLPITEGAFSVIAIWPVDVGTSRIDLHFLKICPDGELVVTEDDREAVIQFSAVIDEDIATLAGMHNAMTSGGLDSIPLSYGEQALYNFHREVDRLIGPERIDPALRVQDANIPVY